MLVTLLGRLAQFGIMFLSVKLMTSLLVPNELGRLALITTTVGFFALFMINPVGMFINRKLHTWFQAGVFRTYFHWYTLYILLVATVASICMIALSLVRPSSIGLTWDWAVALVGGSLVFNTAIQTLVPSLNMLGRGFAFSVVNITTLATSLLISLFLCTGFGATAEHWLAGNIIGQIIFTGLAYRILFKNYCSIELITKPSAVYVTTLLHFCWPISIAVGLNWAHMQGYRFILADNFGLDEFGLFAAGYSVAAAFLSAGETILATWFQPQFYRSINSTDKAERDAAWSKYAARMIPATLLGCTVLIAISSLLPKIMLGSMYQDVGIYIIMGAYAELGRIWVGIYVLHAHQHMSTRRLILPNAVGALSTGFGIVGAIYVLDANIIWSPVIVAVGCLFVVLLLWWNGQRKDLHARLKIIRLAFQAAALFTAAYATHQLVFYLKIDTIVMSLEVIVLISAVWLVFALLMKKELIDPVAKRIK